MAQPAKIKGLAVHFRFGPRGYPEWAIDLEILAGSILTILKTIPGERAYRPTFGCYAVRLLFANMSVAAALRCRSEARRAIETWEPRVIVDDILIDQRDSTIQLTVIWRAKSNPSAASQTTLQVGA